MTPPAGPQRYTYPRFPGAMLRRGVGRYSRVYRSYRGVQELLLKRRLEVAYEAIRQGGGKFGQGSAHRRRRWPCLGDNWRLDAVCVILKGKRADLWRVVGQDDHVLDMRVQSWRNEKAAKKFLRKWLKGLTYVPRVVM